MNISFDIPTILTLFWVVNVCFTACLVLLQTNRIWNGASFWIAGNIAQLAALSLMAKMPHVTVVLAALMLLSQLLKLTAFLRRPARARALIAGNGAIAGCLMLAWLLGGDQDPNIGLRLGSALLICFTSLQGVVCYRQPRWWRLRGSALFVAAAFAVSLFLLAIAIGQLNIPRDNLFVERGEHSQTFFLATFIYFIITHICLVAMLMALMNRIITAGQLRERRQLLQTRAAKLHAQKMSELAEEKESLLEVLIHEVRQPLNNAQAALQDVLMTTRLDSRDYSAGKRLQAIIDRVVLSLSNAIVGASVLERRSKSIMVSTDIALTCELACSDVGPDWAERVELVGAEQPLIAPADPVLLRLALRNLIDNGLKHSLAGHKVRVAISRDNNARVIAIKVTNWPDRPFIPTPELFKRKVRGETPSGDGKGLGLYIAREISLLHRGTIEARATPDKRTEFVISFPA